MSGRGGAPKRGRPGLGWASPRPAALWGCGRRWDAGPGGGGTAVPLRAGPGQVGPLRRAFLARCAEESPEQRPVGGEGRSLCHSRCAVEFRGLGAAGGTGDRSSPVTAGPGGPRGNHCWLGVCPTLLLIYPCFLICRDSAAPRGAETPISKHRYMFTVMKKALETPKLRPAMGCVPPALLFPEKCRRRPLWVGKAGSAEQAVLCFGCVRAGFGSGQRSPPVPVAVGRPWCARWEERVGGAASRGGWGWGKGTGRWWGHLFPWLWQRVTTWLLMHLVFRKLSDHRISRRFLINLPEKKSRGTKNHE